MNNILKKLQIFCIKMLFWCLLLFAQEPDTLWTRTYGGQNDDRCLAAQQTNDGGYILAGSTTSYGNGGVDVYLVKTDSQGFVIWSKTFGGTYNDYCYSIQQTNDDGYILAGVEYVPGIDSGNVYVIKTDSLGDTIWTRTFGGSGMDWARCIRQTTDNGYIVIGGTSSTGAGGEDIYMVKLNSTGDTCWTKVYGGAYNDHGYAVNQTVDGGYIITGWTNSFSMVSYDIWALKTDSIGDTLWSYLYDGSLDDKGTAVIEIPNSCFIIAGWTYSSFTNTDFILISIDTVGIPQWIKTYGGFSYDYAYSVCRTTDDGYILTGTRITFNPNTDDILLIKVNGNGDSLWTATFGGPALERGWFGQQTLDGGYFLTGYTESFGSGGEDFYAIKTNQGTYLVERYPLTAFNNTYKIYPNPFTERITIFYNLNRYSLISIIIYDVEGREIIKLFDGVQLAGQHCIYWNGCNKQGNRISNSVYFVNFIIDAHINKSIKVIKLK